MAHKDRDYMGTRNPEFTTYETAEETAEMNRYVERLWRQSNGYRANVELVASEEEWRFYRRLLRDSTFSTST